VQDLKILNLFTPLPIHFQLNLNIVVSLEYHPSHSLHFHPRISRHAVSSNLKQEQDKINVVKIKSWCSEATFALKKVAGKSCWATGMLTTLERIFYNTLDVRA